jgi:hypothetical protein
VVTLCTTDYDVFALTVPLSVLTFGTQTVSVDTVSRTFLLCKTNSSTTLCIERALYLNFLFNIIHPVLLLSIHKAFYSVKNTSIYPVNNQLDAQFLFPYVYFNSLHVSSNLVLIIRRINCINTTSGMCHSGRLVCRSGRNCILDGHLHTVTHTGCCIDTIESPDDEHGVARKM